ncbi:putative phosphoglycerate mutase family protein [Cercospora zeina]
MKSFLALLLLLPVVLAKPTVYLIRHGEKPSSGNGLNAQGMQRAQCLRNVFGASSDYDIEYILTQDYKKGAHSENLSLAIRLTRPDGSRKRPYDTVKPLAGDLGLKIDHSCDRDDPQCVRDKVDNYSGSGNVLICWEHKALTDIVEKLGDVHAPDYPDDRFDLIWTDPPNYKSITEEYSADCPGLDN